MDELIKERDELDTKIRQLKKEAASKRKALKELNNKRRDFINAIKAKNIEANKAKDKRDSYNDKIKKLKKKRDTANAEIKELREEYKKAKEKTPGGNFKKLQKEKNALEWKLQTSVLEIKKEDTIVKRIAQLEKELEGYKELINISKNLDKKKKTSKKLHDNVISLSDESQTYHEEFVKAVEKIKEVESKLDEINAQKQEYSEALDKINGELDELIPQFKELDKKITEMEIESDQIHQQKSEKELKEEAQVIYEKFKNGEKLDLEDIYLLRRFDLV